MDDIIEENELMKRCCDCEILKMKTDFYFRNINQKVRKIMWSAQKGNKKYKILKIQKKIKKYKKKISTKQREN